MRDLVYIRDDRRTAERSHRLDRATPLTRCQLTSPREVYGEWSSGLEQQLRKLRKRDTDASSIL